MSNSTLVFIACVSFGLYLAFDRTFQRSVYARTEDLLIEGNARTADAVRSYNADKGVNQIYQDPKTGRGYRLEDIAWS
jgi:hypothetical protein